MANLDLHYVNELIDARTARHGGRRGAPLIVNGVRVGASIDRSIVLMVSGLLQGYVEDVFATCAKSVFAAYDEDDGAFKSYWKQMDRWGNPSDQNIRVLFMKIGVPDVLDGLSWQRTTNAKIRAKLKEINWFRNRIAHGARRLERDGQPVELGFQKAIAFTNFAKSFGDRFEEHAQRKTLHSRIRMQELAANLGI